MRYTVELELNMPRKRVVELFDNPKNTPKWQRGLVSCEPLSGTPGQVGAKSRLVFVQGKRRIEMIETVTKRALPDAFDGTYEAKGVFNTVANKFRELPGQRTLWTIDSEFRFAGFMKIIGFCLKSAFPKQTRQFMEDFKAFAETGTTVSLSTKS